MSMSDDTKQSDVFGLQAVRELLQLIGQTDITEFSIERDGARIHIRRSGTAYASLSSTPSVPPVLSASNLAPLGSAHAPHPPQTTPSAQSVDIPDGYIITAPMVGTYYAAPSPRESAFVQEGDEIEAGDTVGIIEAMKIMNEIESEVTGRVSRILVQNEQPVEYGQPLLVIEPM